MTLVNPEAMRRINGNDTSRERAQALIPEGVGVVDISFGPQNTELLNKMLPIRAEFVQAMNWRERDPNYDDRDEYDDLDETLHLSLTDRETGELIAGLRLTRVPSVEESQSWIMLSDNPQMIESALDHVDEQGRNTVELLNETAKRGNLWDLTRLVCPLDENADRKKIVAGIMELFAVGYGTIRQNTLDDEQDDVRWICAATDLVKMTAENLCLDFASAASGRVNKKDYMDTHFCVVKVEETVTNIADHAEEQKFRFPSEHMFNGFRKAGL